MIISKKDLFLAILAMDSYNRGAGAGIDGLSSEAGTTIGTATIGIDSSDDSGVAEDAGFYAIAYTLDEAVGDLAAGTVIISYRGTDNQPYQTSFNPANS